MLKEEEEPPVTLKLIPPTPAIPQKEYVIERVMSNATDGFYVVVVKGETRVHRTEIKSSVQYFTTKDGYDLCHPWKKALENATAIAYGLNQLEKTKTLQELSIV